jgi:hypothetical protein
LIALRLVGLRIDGGPLTAATAAAEQRNMNRFGAFVRRRARSFLRSSKKVSSPGSPPSLHDFTAVTKTTRKGKLRKSKAFRFKDSVLFAYDPEGHSVVIGPTVLSGGDATLPRRLEEGGTQTDRRGSRVRQRQYRPRPWLGPAFEAELPSIPKIWGDSIKA